MRCEAALASANEIMFGANESKIRERGAYVSGGVSASALLEKKMIDNKHSDKREYLISHSGSDMHNAFSLFLCKIKVTSRSQRNDFAPEYKFAVVYRFPIEISFHESHEVSGDPLN